MARAALVFLLCAVPMALAWGDGNGEGSGYGRLARALIHKFADHDMEKQNEAWQEHRVPDFFSWYKMKKYFDGSHTAAHLGALMGEEDLHDMRGYWRRSWGPWSKPAPTFWKVIQQKHDALKQWYDLHDQHMYDDMHSHVDEHLYSHVNPHFNEHLYDHINPHFDEHRYHDDHHIDAHIHAYRHEQFEKFQRFQRYMSAWEEHTKKVEAMRKMHAAAMIHAQVHKEQEFSQMMKSFAEKKKQYVFTVLFEMMKFCKCKESIQNLNRFFNPSGMQNMGNTNNSDIMDIEGQLALLSPKSPEDAKKMFLKGLLQTLCVSAKSYVQHIRMLATQHLALHLGLAGMNSMDGMNSMGGVDSTNGNGGVGDNNGMTGVNNNNLGDAQTTGNRQAVDNNRNRNNRFQNSNNGFGSQNNNGFGSQNRNYGSATRVNFD